MARVTLSCKKHQMMEIVKNTTIQNRTKQERLNREHIVPKHCINNYEHVLEFLKTLKNYEISKEEILFSIGCHLVKENTNKNLKKFLSEYPFLPTEINNVPVGEVDLLGTVYQYLNTKLENLERGSFYTGFEIAKDFTEDLDFSDNQIILDPSCGSGSFLFNSNALSHQIFGVDNDPIAVMISKFNYFIKFPDAEYPNIFCDDFFIWYSNNKNLLFDYIIGNPPYGANLDLSNIDTSKITSKESYSYFITYGAKLLKRTGIIRYLLPESILNVKKHTDIRQFILNELNLKKIKKYDSNFTGVMSDLFLLEIDLGVNGPDIVFDSEGISVLISKNIFKNLKNSIFTFFTEKDVSIIEKVKSKEGYNLKDSIFGLGVVTGNNKEKLFSEMVDGSEPIYTGKEVEKYRLLPPNKFIIFNRDELQQVAPDNVYRADSKLVYKTINKHLKFAIDTGGSLTTNSANIVIPKLKQLDIYSILGLLNSKLYSFMNVKLFGGVNKVSKENIQNLPIPMITKEQNLHIKHLVLRIMDGETEDELERYINYEIFQLNDDECDYLNQVLMK
jgi:hypothetical protein